jgi:hypothetical protein
MTDSSSELSGWKLAARGVLVVMAVPILYVAASGPLLHYAVKYHVEAIREFYRPLLVVAKNTRVQSPLIAYWGWWEPTLGVHRRYWAPRAATPKPE